MITYDGKKYACISCIRGHRSSTCDHRERPLIQVRKRGRPLPENSQRIALLPDSKMGDRVMKTLAKIDGDSNGSELIYTDRFVFEPVGNGLYRKHILADFKQDEHEHSPFSEFEHDPQLIAPMSLNMSDLGQLGVTEEEANTIWPQGQPQFIPSCVMPNQCQCGDECACIDCYTHGNKFK